MDEAKTRRTEQQEADAAAAAAEAAYHARSEALGTAQAELEGYENEVE